MCSGTECPILVWQSWAEALKLKFGHAPSWHHSLGCERDERKSHFIKTMFPKLLLFCDVLELGNDEATTWPDKLMQLLPSDLQVLFAGFPCTSASTLNIHSSSEENRNCVENEDLATGGVFAGILKFLEQHGSKLRIIILENVLALAKKGKNGSGSNLDSVFKKLRQHGWWAKVWHFQPRDNGTPASRPRVWLLCVPFFIFQCKGWTEDTLKTLNKKRLILSPDP